MKYLAVLALLITLITPVGVADADWWASEVVTYNRLGDSPYDDPLAVLGKPTTWIAGSGVADDPGDCACSLVLGSWNVAPNGSKLIVTVKGASQTLPAGYIVVKFATPIYDDPQNWYGKDFIVFGNSMFSSGGSYVYHDSDMEQIIISGRSGWWEASPVSVSQDGNTWYAFSNGPYADDYAPVQAFAWDWVQHAWLKNSSGKQVEMDFTRPVDSTLTTADFDLKTAAQAIDMYRGSGGGTAFDLADVSLPVDPVSGRKWIQYIKVDGTNGEVDALARVSHTISSMSIGEAKKLPDGTRVVLNECVVSAGTYEVGRFCYVEHPNRSGGIKVMGRVIERDKHYILYGDMDTMDDERVILATSVVPVLDEQGQDVTKPVLPLGMPNRSIAGIGLSTTGLLVRTWGKVKSVDMADKSFVLDDGSGRLIKCLAPRDTQAEGSNKGSVPNPNFIPPAQESFARVSGICSGERNAQNGLVAVVRLRTALDLQ